MQDRFGRPKRDISTIIHILNDLLCATPQYRAAARSGTPAVCTATTLPPTASAAQATAPFTNVGSVSAQTSATSDNIGKKLYWNVLFFVPIIHFFFKFHFSCRKRDQRKCSDPWQNGTFTFDYGRET